MLEHFIIQFLLYYQSNGHSREAKNNIEFQTFSCKSGRSRLEEVFIYKRFCNLTWTELCGISKIGHQGEVIPTEGSTVWDQCIRSMYQINILDRLLKNVNKAKQ